MMSMSNVDLLALGGSNTEPNFEIAVRGYKRDQVDKYFAQAEGEIAALGAERDAAYTQLQALASQLQEAHIELAELRRQAARGDVSFRHLGPRVEQILALTEDQAEEIRASAVNEIAERRSEADRLLAEARKRAIQANQDFELAL